MVLSWDRAVAKASESCEAETRNNATVEASKANMEGDPRRAKTRRALASRLFGAAAQMRSIRAVAPDVRATLLGDYRAVPEMERRTVFAATAVLADNDVTVPVARVVELARKLIRANPDGKPFLLGRDVAARIMVDAGAPQPFVMAEDSAAEAEENDGAALATARDDAYHSGSADDPAETPENSDDDEPTDA